MHTPRCFRLLIPCFFWTPIFAEKIEDPAVISPKTSELSELSLEELMEIPVESVGGVSKYQQSIRRAPAGVTVFTAADIRNHGWSTLADVLRAAPGLHVRSDRFYSYVGTRGFTRGGDYNSRTLILLDGHRLDDPIYQQGAIGTDFILDMDLVDRIEVITGPGSSVYGSNAFYGAVNVIPKTGRDISGGELGFALGSEPSGKVRATVGDRTDGGVDYIVSATEWWSRGEDNFPLPAEWRAVDPVQLVGTKAKNQDDMHHQSLYSRVSWRGLSAEAAYVRREKDVLPAVFFTPNGSRSEGIDERAYALIRATGEPMPDATLNAKLSVDVYNYEGRFTPVQTGFVLAPYANSLSINGEVSWRQTFADVHSFSVGVEYQENLRQDYGINLPTLGGSLYDIQESSRYVSPFVQLDWEFTRTLRASLGARYDVYSTGDERLTPRVGLIWDATSATTLKLLYGEAFRVPNVGERFPGTANPNPNIGPETNQSLEFVAEHRLGPVWRVESHLYHVVSSDLIIYEDPPIDMFENTDRYVTHGVDVGASAYYPSGVQLRGSVTVQETRDDATGQIVVDAPRTLAKMHASVPVVDKRVRASAELLYVGNRKDTGGADTGDYLTMNFTLRAARVWRGWDLALSVYNVADARWSDPKDVGQISSPPRSAVLRATLDF